MAAGRSQDSSMLYAVIIFVVLFIASTVFAVIFYLKITDFQKTVLESEKKVNALASPKELRQIGTLAGKDLPRQTALGSMLARFDAVTEMTLGSVPENTSAEAKFEMIKQKKAELLAEAAAITGDDANSIGFVRAVELLKEKYGQSKAQQDAIGEKLAELEKLFDEEKKAAVEKEKEMSLAIAKLGQDANSATSSYEKLKEAMQQSSDSQVAAIASQLDASDQNLKKSQQELLLTQAKLRNAEVRIENMQSQLESIMPKPDNLSAALKADGKIVSIDDLSKTVIINLGREDHIYRGLTFAVYDKSLPIPKSGKGKATIEVFDVRQNVSAARITEADKRDTIMADDKIANLIWDGDARREFVVAGEFAFADGAATIKNMVQRWGGVVADTVSISTSFVVLGNAPQVPPKPTADEMAADPRAKDKYESALQKLQQYNELIAQAKALSIPVFNLERFLDFVGYNKSAAEK